jgi:hypothetical protein
MNSIITKQNLIQGIERGEEEIERGGADGGESGEEIGGRKGRRGREERSKRGL